MTTATTLERDIASTAAIVDSALALLTAGPRAETDVIARLAIDGHDVPAIRSVLGMLVRAGRLLHRGRVLSLTGVQPVDRTQVAIDAAGTHVRDHVEWLKLAEAALDQAAADCRYRHDASDLVRRLRAFAAREEREQASAAAEEEVGR